MLPPDCSGCCRGNPCQTYVRKEHIYQLYYSNPPEYLMTCKCPSLWSVCLLFHCVGYIVDIGFSVKMHPKLLCLKL